MLVAVAIGGYVVLTSKKPEPMLAPMPSTPSPTGPMRNPRTGTPLMDAKYNLHDCTVPDTPNGVAAFKAGKAQCVTEGNKHGIIFQFTNGYRCTVKCMGGTLDLLTAADKKKLGIDKCKCDAVRADLEKVLRTSSSYARAYKVYYRRRLN
jgi:hypothetical protein